MLVNKIKKEKAIKLRRQGKTYSEILKEIDVAKSTLSEWFRDVGLSVPEQQKLTKKKLAAARRGGAAIRVQRMLRTKQIIDSALEDLKSISDRELWLIGIALYWAEGTKEKDFRPGGNLAFNNSDSRMVRVFVQWLLRSCGVNRNRVRFEIYIHQNSKNRVIDAQKHWSKVTHFPISKFTKVYYKKTATKTNRKNIGDLYYGLLRVKVSASSSLLRQVAGWTEGIVRSV